MTRKMRFELSAIVIAAIIPVAAISQGQNQTLTLVVSGYAGSVPVTQMNGKNYVEIESLAQVVRGSIAFNGNQITLTLPLTGDSTQAATGTNPAANRGFSTPFLRAGIETMSTIREWHTALASAIENQLPVAQDWLTPYQAQSTTNLRLTQAAVTSDADRSAMQLITNVYQKMKQLSDKYVAKRADLEYIAPDALKNDPLDHNIVACGKSLGAMAASGQFVDDGVCQ